MRESGTVMSHAVLIAIGIDWNGRRQILAVKMANRESGSSWKDFLVGLRKRDLHGAEFVAAAGHTAFAQPSANRSPRPRSSAATRTPAQRFGSPASQGRRRLSAGIALAL